MQPRLSESECATLRSLASVLLPAHGAIAFSHVDVDYIAFTQNFLADVPPQARWLMKGTLWILDWLGWLWCQPWPRRFSRLSSAKQERVIEGWRSSSIPTLRSVLQVVSLPLLMPFYQDPRVLKALGISPGIAPGLMPGFKPRDAS